MKRKREIISLSIALVLALLLLLVVNLGVKAEGTYPEGVYVFEVGDHTCVLTENDLECFCPCFSSECAVSASDEKPVSTENPEPTDEPKPTKTEKPKPTQKPKPTKVPKSTKESKGNCGDGNGPEGNNPTTNCDEKKNNKQDEK